MSPSKARANEVVRTSITNDIVLFKVTCNINAKGQSWNENIWTVARPKEKTSS